MIIGLIYSKGNKSIIKYHIHFNFRGVWELPGDDTKHANDFEWPNQDEVLVV